MQQFKMGNWVTWNTGGKRCTSPRYQRTGEVTEVIAAGEIPTTYADGKYTLRSRNHESYIVTVGSHKYWPLVNSLREKT